MKLNIIIISLLLSATGFSQSISTEAPSVSASAVTVPSGFLQGELSTQVSIQDNGTNPDAQFDQLPFLLVRYGITERLELRLEQNTSLNRFNGNTSYRMNHLGIGAKYSILPNDGNTNLAAIARYSPYNGGWDGNQGDITLAFSHVFLERHSVGANLGYSLFRLNPGEPNPITTMYAIPFSAVYSFQFADNWTAFGEVFGNYNELTVGDVSIFSGDNYGVDFGLQFLLRENIQLDWVSGFGLTSKYQFHSLGFNIYFDTKKK
ncbi:MAG: transporter [bacterium]|nr:transporter [bacterium]